MTPSHKRWPISGKAPVAQCWTLGGSLWVVCRVFLAVSRQGRPDQAANFVFVCFWEAGSGEQQLTLGLHICRALAVGHSVKDGGLHAAEILDLTWHHQPNQTQQLLLSRRNGTWHTCPTEGKHDSGNMAAWLRRRCGKVSPHSKPRVLWE